MTLKLPLTSIRSKALRVAKKLERMLGTLAQRCRLPSPLDMLIATVLSQNTNDKNSHRAYTMMRRDFPTWKAVAQAPSRELVQAIRVGGMANQKSKNIQAILRKVYARYGKYDLGSMKAKSDDEVLQELTTLHGVGVKTASCVLLFSFGRDVFPVDTHVHRICNRLGLVRTRTPEETFKLMSNIFPRGRGYSFHTNLIRFGRKICRSDNPACEICPLFDECGFEKKGQHRHAKRSSSFTDHDFMLLDNIRDVA